MKRNILFKISVGLFILLLIGIQPALSYPEVPVNLSEEDIARIVSNAPAIPVDPGLGLDLELVDFINCTDVNDPHPMMDQGTSSVTKGPAGVYRETSMGRNSFFSYRWKSSARDMPHVLVIEYPDDAKREICFLTHESQMSGRANIDWSLETGVYTGNPLPVTGRMQYHTMFFWPQDNWPVIIVANWNRQGAPAAAGRIWIYRVKGDHLPPMDICDPDPANPRIIGDLYNWSLVPVRNIFGRTNRSTAFDHIVEYYQYLGCNLVSWPVVSNNDWGFKCRIDAWDGDDENDELEGILSACDKKGMFFIASFEIGRGFTIGKKRFADDPASFRKGLLEGFEEFIKRYGHHKSLYGIAFGTPDFGPPYGQATIDIIKESGGIDEFVKFIHDRKSELKIFTFIGAEDLHREYFRDMWGVMNRWENSTVRWDRHLADEALKLWKTWGRDPSEFSEYKGLTVVHQYQPDDHGIYDSYAQQPRSMVYYDLDNSQQKSTNIDTRAVMIWNTFYESWLGLHPEVNFWYMKLWNAPDFNASEPYANISWSRVMEHRDRNVIIAGAWNRKSGGHEASLRQFAKSLRELPPVEMEDVTTKQGDAVKIRKVFWQDKTYISILSLSPFPEQLKLNAGKAKYRISLMPYSMQTIVEEGKPIVTAKIKTSIQYKKYVGNRISDFMELYAELKQIEPEAAGLKFSEHLQYAREVFKGGKIHAADIALGHGLFSELQLRKRLIKPDVYIAGRVVSTPEPGDHLDNWPANSLDIIADNGSYLSTHLYFPNSWSGPGDLSARIRLCHDGKKLYVGVKVNDNVINEKDNVSFWLSGNNYRNWRENSQEVELLNLETGAPVDNKTISGKNSLAEWTVYPLEGGYYWYVVVEMEKLKLVPGDSVGFLFRIGDHDGTPNLNGARWAMDATMLVPHSENFENWSDARNCLELKLAE